ncbi:hypothetical protein TIFTF001_032589 [Ficus carica]|uniref:Uncharacterized protein n=1 Tax=Ficus carica TaxID=3494 RepID=A0AA88DYQ6_FICCA|nr:hypothetical protein TIFTF001_032589 [Ficus carica]
MEDGFWGLWREDLEVERKHVLDVNGDEKGGWGVDEDVVVRRLGKSKSEEEEEEEAELFVLSIVPHFPENPK